MHMLRERMGEDRFCAMLAELARQYDRKAVTTEQFRALAAQFMPSQSGDPGLQAFFDQWVYGTGIPSLAMTYAVKGTAPALTVAGTVTQSGVDDDFSVAAPVEIQVSHDRTITQWVRTRDGSGQFTVALKQAPLKVTLDPHDAVLRN